MNLQVVSNSNLETNFNLDSQWEYYYPKVYGYFFRRLDNRSDVEELTSIVLCEFFRVLLEPNKSSRIQNQNAYLWRIAHNYLVNFVDQKSKKPLPIALDDNFEPNFESESWDKFTSRNYNQRVENLMNCVKSQLQGEEYQIVVYSVLEDKKSAEVASLLNLKADNVRQKLSRSLKKLREKCRQIWSG